MRKAFCRLVEKYKRLVYNLEKIKNTYELYTYESETVVKEFLAKKGIVCRDFKQVEMKLEDAFIGLTGKY